MNIEIVLLMAPIKLLDEVVYLAFKTLCERKGKELVVRLATEVVSTAVSTQLKRRTNKNNRWKTSFILNIEIVV